MASKKNGNNRDKNLRERIVDSAWGVVRQNVPAIVALAGVVVVLIATWTDAQYHYKLADQRWCVLKVLTIGEAPSPKDIMECLNGK